MQNDDLEEKLRSITLPDVPPLKHQDTVMRGLFTERRTKALVIWIVAVPLYMVACGAMKTLFHAGLPFQSSMEEIRLSLGQPVSIIAFLFLPFFGLAAIAASSVRLRQDDAGSGRYLVAHLSPANAVLALLALSIVLYSIFLLW